MVSREDKRPRKGKAGDARLVAHALSDFVEYHGAPNRVTPLELTQRHDLRLDPRRIGAVAHVALALLRRVGWDIDYGDIRGQPSFTIRRVPDLIIDF